MRWNLPAWAWVGLAVRCAERALRRAPIHQQQTMAAFLEAARQAALGECRLPETVAARALELSEDDDLCSDPAIAAAAASVAWAVAAAAERSTLNLERWATAALFSSAAAAGEAAEQSGWDDFRWLSEATLRQELTAKNLFERDLDGASPEWAENLVSAG